MKIKLPPWFWIIAILALLWNLMGVLAFFSDLNQEPPDLTGFAQNEVDYYNSFPSWTKIVYGVAVFGGVLGCIGLLLRKLWSKHILGISLFAVLIQFGFSIGRLAKYDMLSADKLIMPALVVLIAIGLIVFARYASNKHWLT